MKLRAARTAAATIAAVGGTLTVTVPIDSAIGATVKKCPVVSTGGHKYNVSAIGVSCSFADTWTKKVAKKRLKPHTVNAGVSGGPAGYSCRAGTKPPGSAMTDIPANVQTGGNCAKGLFAHPYFNWTVQSKY